MKKKVLVAMMATTLLLAGCSSNTTNSEVKDEPTKVEAQEDKDKASEVESEEPASETETTDDVKFADMIPDPKDIFANGQIYINDLDGGKSYFFQVENYTEDEYDAYVQGCKDMGFTKIQYESENDGGKMFGAYTEDEKYWVEVLLGNKTNLISVTCKFGK